jgi:hypothetical protein
MFDNFGFDTSGPEALAKIATGESESTAAEQNAIERPTQNAAIIRCLRAWQRAYNKNIAKPECDEFHAKRAGDRAFLRAMPPLSGYDNIRDFIACVTYAIVINSISHDDTQSLFLSAKIALAALRQDPNHAAIHPV